MRQLRFTTTKPMGMLGIFNPVEDHKPLFVPENVGELIHDTVKGRTSYIHDDAEDLAGYDIPTFIDGNLGQLDLPIEEQDILMVLPSGEYHCKSELSTDIGSRNAYLITLK